MANIGHDFHLLLPDQSQISFHSFKFSENVTFIWFGVKSQLDHLSSAFCCSNDSSIGLQISDNPLCDKIAQNMAQKLKNNKQIFVSSDMDLDDHGKDNQLIEQLIRVRIFEEMKKFPEKF
uniref:Uncharacterized protein n=1 Tax=Romanomermis culicivorax TaxID=13658 RepID=A0A915IR26_ROMCU